MEGYFYKKSMEIQSSKNYSIFKKITGNRIVNEKKIERLMQDITSGLDLLKYCPIVVYRQNEKFMIVDGQHRFETSKRLELPVYFVICDELDLKQIARLNSRSDKWKNRDFLECYMSLGVKDYEILSDFIDEFGIIYSASIDLLMFGNVKGNKNSMDIFRDGEFVVNHLEAAKHATQLTRDTFERYRFRNDRYLIQAMQDIEKAGLCDFSVLKQKIAAAPNLMDSQGSAKEYIYNIERVYNHNNQKRVVIF
jgi:hypothetical protein